MRTLKAATFVYIVFAILVAHAALARPVIDIKFPFLQVVIDDERPATPDLDKSSYTVEVWSSKRCMPCKTYKLVEVPLLRRLGYTVVMRDVDKEGWPDSVKSVPTTRLHHKGKLLTEEKYWRALAIDRYIRQRASLKE
jgi:hypothetical protein